MTEIEEKYYNSLWTLKVIFYTAAITLLEKGVKSGRPTGQRKNM